MPVMQDNHHLPLIKEAGIDSLPFNFDFSKILRGLFRHVPLILFIMALGTFIAAFVSHKILQNYNAQSVLIYSQQHSGKSVEENYQILHLTLPSAVEMVTLPVQLKAVKSILGLDLSVEQLEEMVSVAPPVKDSNFVTINVVARSPALAMDIANTLANVVVKNTQDLSKKQWQAAYAYFKNQETMLRQKLFEQNQAIARFKKEHQLMGTDLGGSSYLDNLKNAQEKLQTANYEYSRLLVEYENLKEQYKKLNLSTSQQIFSEDPILKNRVSQLQIALLDARSRYAPENPKIKALEFQLSELLKSMSAQKEEAGIQVIEDTNAPSPLREKLNLELIGMQARLQALAKLREEMTSSVKEFENAVSVWNEQQAELIKLYNGQTTLENQLKANEEMQRTVEIMLNLAKGDLELYQSADKAFSYNHSTLVNLLPALGFLLGSILGIGGAFIAEISDKKIRTSQQVDRCYNIPCLVAIPQFQLQLAPEMDPKVFVYIRSLAERLALLGPFHSLAITSSKSHEGKSFVIHYLAQFYARSGKKVLILELNPKSNPFIPEGEESPKLLDSYLRGQIGFDTLITEDKINRIKGGFDSDMPELIGSPQMQTFLEKIKQIFDVVLIEAPAILEEETAIKATALGEKSVFLIGSSEVKKYFIDNSLKELEIYRIKPCGIILNDVYSVYMDNLRLAAQDKKHRKGFFEKWFSKKRQENMDKTDL